MVPQPRKSMTAVREPHCFTERTYSRHPQIKMFLDPPTDSGILPWLIVPSTLWGPDIIGVELPCRVKLSNVDPNRDVNVGELDIPLNPAPLHEAFLIRTLTPVK